MAKSRAHEEYFPVEEEEDKAKLTPFELQKIVMELSKRVAKLECYHAKF